MNTGLALAHPVTALARIGADDMLVTLDDGGCLRRVESKLRLFYGTHLYAACAPGREKPDTKVEPFQPGAMAEVHARGGQLFCPPAVTDHAGVSRPNPYVETDPRTGTTFRSTATAVCFVPNPLTGAPVVSVMSAVVDIRNQFVQSIQKLATSEQNGIIVPDEFVNDARAEKPERRYWAAIPVGPGLTLLYNQMCAAAREAIQDYTNASLTIRQRSQSKAERLTAAHNPVTRHSWQMADLWVDWKVRGKEEIKAFPWGMNPNPRPKNEGDPTPPFTHTCLTAPYVEITVAAWVDGRRRADIQGWLSELAAQNTRHEEATMEYVRGHAEDAPDTDGDGDIEDAPRATDPPRLADAGPRRDIIDVPPERVPVPVAATIEAPKAAPVAPPVAAAPAAPAAPAPDKDQLRFIGQIVKFRAALVDVKGAYEAALSAKGLAPDADLNTVPAPVLMGIRDVLKAGVERLG